MFDQYGTDYAKPALQLNDLLPIVNRSEASYSVLSTLFQRWLSKPNLSNVAGTIGFSKTPLASAVQETTANRTAYQLYPVFYREQGDEKLVMDWNDILRKIAFTGVDATKYDQWGTTTAFDFCPPIAFDKFVNYNSYFWVNSVDTTEQPDYVTITPDSLANDWSSSNKWVHRNDLGGNLAFAKQAQLPIIEFDDIELSRWFKVQRTWKKFDPLSNEYVSTTAQPPWAALDFTPPTSHFAELIDPTWELQSERLVPVGDTVHGVTIDTALTSSSLPTLVCVVKSPTTDINFTTKTVTVQISSDATGAISRSYLRGQSNIVLYKNTEVNQITTFTEVETASTQMSSKVTIPFDAFVDPSVTPTIETVTTALQSVRALIGTQCTVEAFRLVPTKRVRLAPGFTSYTPATGASFGINQYRDLYEYKLIGQRRLNKYQLPVFNLYTLYNSQNTGIYNEATVAGHVLTYDQDISQPVDLLLGQRIATSADLSFTLDLVTPTGELLTYKRNDVATSSLTDAHYTVWKNASAHTPSYVDATRTPLTDKTLPGGWEPSRLLTANPLRETRSNFKFGEVINHFQLLAANKPGSITISDDGGNYLMSSLIADNLSVPALVSFVADELYTYRTQLEQQIKSLLLTTSVLQRTASSEIPVIVYNMLRTTASVEGGANSIYDDTLSYDAATNLGYPNFPLTFGTLGLTAPVSISVESDKKLKHAAIVTHDGSRYNLNLTARDVASLETAMASAIALGTGTPAPATNFSVWQLSATETYRFECYYFSNSTPSTSTPGQTWYNPDTGIAKIWTIAGWQGIVANSLWIPFDVSQVILEILALQERDIIALIRHRSLPVIEYTSQPPSAQVAVNAQQSYSTFAFQYQLHTDSTQFSSRLLSAPSATDPFTWFYGNVDPTTTQWPTAIPTSVWPSSVYELYITIYGTPVPHKQPWKLQGYADKPTWWDMEYRDSTGNRVWSTTMWTNIATGVIPYGKSYGNGAMGTGAPVTDVNTYAVIPVNNTDFVVNGYAPDDLLPPYINTQDPTNAPLLPYTLIAATPPPAVQNPTATLGEYLVFPTTYLAGSYLENIWKSNEECVSRSVISAYQIDPITVVTKLLNRNHKLIGGVVLNARTNNVRKNTDLLHGEQGTIDTTIFAALTFFARRSNFTSHDNSPLYAWKTWSTRLAYQTNSLVVPQTLKIYQDCYDLNEYSIVLKKSENIRKISFSNVLITLDSMGDPTLGNGRGDNWTFKLSCSEADPVVRHRYDILQQSFTWNASAQLFTPTITSQRIRWIAGESIQLVNPPASLASTVFYIGLISGGVQLHTSAADAVTNTNAVDFGSLFATDIQFRTVKATFTAGQLNWETVEVDRRSIVEFNFANNILITGVQNVIDFVVSYSEYMQDDGIVINAGETTALDPDTNAVISWQQQISKAVDRIITTNGLSAVGYRPVFVPGADGVYRPVTANRMSISTPFAEINPFRAAVYFHTPDGVLCDFNHTPYVNEYDSASAIYDDTATPLTAIELIPLRTDRLTAVVFNDSLPPRPVNTNQDISRRIAFGSVSLDFYEHALVFDQQTSNGLTIFDRFFNLQKSFLNLEMQKSVDFYYRPVMGGFSVTQAGTIPNFETVADYQRNDYDVSESNELIQSTIDSRQMLGKLPLPYFQNIPVTSKTEFQFWQQMIREKGTKGAVSTFARHALYDDVQYDEFWAWKLGTFGAVSVRKQLEMTLTANDVRQLVNTFWFSNATPPVTTAFNITSIPPLDQSRWIDFPDYLDAVGQTGVVVGQTPTSTVTLVKTTRYMHFNLVGDVFAATTPGSDIEHPHVLDSSVFINHNTIDTASVDTGTVITITGYLPSYSELSPMRVVDVNSKVVVKTLPAWDPANGVHTTAIAQFDYIQSTTPAYYNRTLSTPSASPWGTRQVGQYWLDSSSLRYKPYFDSNIFAFDDRTRVWGDLEDGAAITAYQWVEDTAIPTIKSTNSPYMRNVLKTRIPTVITGTSGTVFTAASVPFITNMNVVLYKSTTNSTPIVDAVLGVEYTIQVISPTTFSLLNNGTAVTLPASAESTELFVTNVWSDVSTIALTPLYRTIYACDFAPNTVVFQIPNVANVQQDLTSSAAVVNVNGESSAFSITESGLLSLFTDTGSIRLVNPEDIITVSYPQQAMYADGIPPVSSAQLSYVDVDVPYTEATTLVNELEVTKYYYWSAKPATTSNPVKSATLESTVLELTRPQSGNYMGIHSDRQLVSVWGLFGLHQVASKALAIDLDSTLRDRYINSAVSKPTNEQWVLFREFQDGSPNSQIWDFVESTVTGMRSLNPTTTIVVPTPDRASYDYLYDTTLSYGTGSHQTLISPVRARELFIDFFSIVNPLIDPTLHVLLTGIEWTTLIATKQYAAALRFVSTNLPSTLLNSFIFVILREGMYSGYHYDGIFKTSYVALQTSQKVVVG